MISIITSTKRPDFLQNIVRNFENQDIKEKELVLILHGFSENLSSELLNNPLIKLVYSSIEQPLGTCLNEGILQAKYNIIARFDDDDYYGPHYLSEALKTMEEKDVEIIGKQSLFIYFIVDQQLSLLFPGKENRFIKSQSDTLAGSTLIFKKKIVDRVIFQPVSLGEDTAFLEECKKLRIRMYASTPDHYVHIRYPYYHHTSDADNRRLKSHCLPLVKTKCFLEYVN
ncbi:glycosyltransferase family 2 protein [Bacillus massilinigeriensis]|uniref:glycosyltransferase n=1 Tax=Bacillus mediterraneensis TaxID=1805474 RepID=UPI0008F90EF5|nr:glycosyltransferase family 2 protein [Bacillus mediterraneensis]